MTERRVAKKMGRPTIYTDELAFEICMRIASGRSMQSVCLDVDMPDQATVYRWKNDRGDFCDMVARAVQDRLEAYQAQMIALGRRVLEEDDLSHNRVNAAVNAIDRAARLQMPKQQVEHTGSINGAVPASEVPVREKAKAILHYLDLALTADVVQDDSVE